MRIFALVLLAAVCAFTLPAGAATMQATDDAIVITGKFTTGDDVQFAELLKAHPSVKVVILYDSPGGNGMMMQRITAEIRSKLLATGVAGYCNSACAMIFLSGTQRYFTDLLPLDRTWIGFHGSYRPDGNLAREERLHMIAGMIATETAGKADPALVQRWTHLPKSSMMRFMYPGADGAPTAATVFLCDSGTCSPVPGYDALKMGIITTTQILHVAQ